MDNIPSSAISEDWDCELPSSPKSPRSQMDMEEGTQTQSQHTPIPIPGRLMGMLRDSGSGSISPALSYTPPSTTEEGEGRISIDSEHSQEESLHTQLRREAYPYHPTLSPSPTTTTTSTRASLSPLTPTTRIRSSISPSPRRLFAPKFGRSPLHTLSISPPPAPAPLPPAGDKERAVLQGSEIKDSLEDIPLSRLGGRRRKWSFSFKEGRRKTPLVGEGGGGFMDNLRRLSFVSAVGRVGRHSRSASVSSSLGGGSGSMEGGIRGSLDTTSSFALSSVGREATRGSRSVEITRIVEDVWDVRVGGDGEALDPATDPTSSSATFTANTNTKTNSSANTSSANAHAHINTNINASSTTASSTTTSPSANTTNPPADTSTADTLTIVYSSNTAPSSNPTTTTTTPSSAPTADTEDKYEEEDTVSFEIRKLEELVQLTAHELEASSLPSPLRVLARGASSSFSSSREGSPSSPEEQERHGEEIETTPRTPLRPLYNYSFRRNTTPPGGPGERKLTSNTPLSFAALSLSPHSPQVPRTPQSLGRSAFPSPSPSSSSANRSGGGGGGKELRRRRSSMGDLDLDIEEGLKIPDGIRLKQDRIRRDLEGVREFRGVVSDCGYAKNVRVSSFPHPPARR
ncbi:hypothetical protein BDQ17DRAFT_482338 [Cyathus striatus]|nr:hypothetical protein BDQ17DRAFT_482338 [Cyathus striatus]